MSFIATNPLLAAETSSTPPSPIRGVRAFFPKSDGWYEMDSNGNVKKIVNSEELNYKADNNTVLLVSKKSGIFSITPDLAEGYYVLAPNTSLTYLKSVVAESDTDGVGLIYTPYTEEIPYSLTTETLVQVTSQTTEEQYYDKQLFFVGTMRNNNDYSSVLSLSCRYSFAYDEIGATTGAGTIKYDTFVLKSEAPEGSIVDQTYSSESKNAQSGIAVAEAVKNKADKQTENGGFAGGQDAIAESEGAAVGMLAESYALGFAGGSMAIVDGNGAAVGESATAGDGFSGGSCACVGLNDEGASLDAIQLGAGTNNEEKTLQVYDHKLMNADGSIPDERLPQLQTINDQLDEIEAIAKGANQALTFDNYEAMWNCFVPLAQDSHRVGQNVLIRTLEVPDLWISEIMDSQADECISAEGLFCGDDAFVELLKTNGKIQISYYVFSALETQKVDLNEYATKEEVNTEQTAREEKDTELEENILSLTPKCVEEAQPGQVYLINNTHHIASVYPDPYNDFSVHFSKAITELEDCFECSLYIKPYAGEQVSYKDETGVIIYFGDDCSEAGEFTPQANTHYEISFKRLGTDDSSNPLIIARVGAWQ